MISPLSSIPLPGGARKLTRIGLGGMRLSLAGRPDHATAKATVRRAVEMGLTLIDTADSYALDDSEIGHNERLIAEALAEMGLRADGDVLIATKGGKTRSGGQFHPNAHPDHLRKACHASLRALSVERISLYQLHAPDPAVDFADSVGALARLKDEGKIEEVGLSNVSVDQVRTAQRIVRVSSVQNAMSVWDVGYRRPPVLELCRREGIPFLAYSPLGGSTRAAALGSHAPLARLAAELGATPHELALAWLLHQAPVVVPIPSATSPSRVESSVRALSITLSSAELGRVTKTLRTLPGNKSLIQRVAGRLVRMTRR